MLHDRFGFSTGALEKGDFRKAIAWIHDHHMREVELSALRYEELEPLVNALGTLNVENFEYVSFHAPTSFTSELETHVIRLLEPVFARGWNIIIHPDVVYTPARWHHFSHQLLLENMDRRKSTGRTVIEMQSLLKELPYARLCLDIAHARQMDTTLTLLRSFTDAFKDRIAEIHISELDSRCRHLPLSLSAVADYRRFAEVLHDIPVIIESMLPDDGKSTRREELDLAKRALSYLD